jgi:uncharacterized membrane protein YsdA (DUF1294 family)
LVYYYDKRSAKWGKWRVPEKNLHFLSLIGGSMAALLCTFVMRHKIRKRGFMLTLFLMIILQLIGLVYWTENYT